MQADRTGARRVPARALAVALLVGGLLAGVGDIAFALSFAAYRGTPPVRLLQTVASGLLGTDAYAGGVPAAALGLALHFGLSLLWAGLFVGLASFVPWLARHPLASGVAFGIV